MTKPLSYVVQRADGMCLDMIAPDQWINKPFRAMSSEDKGFIERHAARREGCVCIERTAAVIIARKRGVL